MTTPNPMYAGDGGNSTLTNGDEQDMLADCIEGIPAQAVGYQEDDSHRVGVFARADDVAGS